MEREYANITIHDKNLTVRVKKPKNQKTFSFFEV